MTSPPDPVRDPAGTIVDLVMTADAGLDRDTVLRIVEQTGGGRAKRRRLAAALVENPSVLTSGRSPAPKSVGGLLLALREAGAAGIALPRCAECDREVTSMQRRAEHWYCPPCFVRPQQCSACGHERQVAFRDRLGRPRCGQCPDQDDPDPTSTLVNLITEIDPGLSAQTVSLALGTVVTKPAHLHKLAWILREGPELLTGDGAKAPVPMLLRLIDTLVDAGATTIRRPPCPSCRRIVPLTKQRDGMRVCRTCYARARTVACSRCGTLREPAARDEQGRPLCPYCLISDPDNLEDCLQCGRRQRVSTRTADGPLCPTCRPQRILTCTICARTVPCLIAKATGQPWCPACARLRATCSSCGRMDIVRGGTRQAPLCGTCLVPDPTFWKTCPHCGASGRLTSGACARCHLHEKLRSLLHDSTGGTRPELEPLHRALADTDRPAIALGWLSRPAVGTLLTRLATGDSSLTHSALDDLPPSKTLTHLRSVLVATGGLPRRDEHLAQLERWTIHKIAARPDPEERKILHQYGTWHVVRRIRQRSREATTANQAAVARRRLSAATSFLDWLAEHELTLATAGQGDLDQWAAEATINGFSNTGHFIRWAKGQKLTRLDLPALRWTGPMGAIDTEARWEQARRLLADSDLKPTDRVAGLLVLLYAQRPAAISRLTLDHVHREDQRVRLQLGSVPVVLPDPLANLVLHVVADRQGHASLGAPDTSPWLFPGGRPGDPISSSRLAERLHAIGILPGQSRSAALFQLAEELPAALLARMLGIHISVAVQWQRAAAGDWANYAAEVSRRTTTS
ncbi:site-specific integrase [Streptomyces sp. JV185]|uniref:site-specific integrase n=1 Tax=Streptomyces sp. JV185 TaxID=858638 RepID=UPI002E764096|nr:site-specific integrase [Streptomyces sp. JV185]MEE1767288.1 site-specific integrase [Streptomyces sp. JV185]